MLRTTSEIITKLKWARAYWYQNYTRKEQNYITDLVWQLELPHKESDDIRIDYARIDRLLNRAEYWQQHQDYIAGCCPMDQDPMDQIDPTVQSDRLRTLLEQITPDAKPNGNAAEILDFVRHRQDRENK